MIFATGYVLWIRLLTCPRCLLAVLTDEDTHTCAGCGLFVTARDCGVPFRIARWCPGINENTRR